MPGKAGYYSFFMCWLAVFAMRRFVPTLWSLPCDGAFICLGGVPETNLLHGQIALDKQGYILANETTITNLPGVFAAGDVRTKLLRGILTAAADGAAAAQQAERYIVENI